MYIHIYRERDRDKYIHIEINLYVNIHTHMYVSLVFVLETWEYSGVLISSFTVIPLKSSNPCECLQALLFLKTYFIQETRQNHVLYRVHDKMSVLFKCSQS